MFLKKLAGRTDIEDALQRLENVTLEETRMTGAETLKAIHGVKVMIQGLTDMLQQGANVRVEDTDDNAINRATTVQFPVSNTLIVYLVRC
jgi:hypothetical protein